MNIYPKSKINGRRTITFIYTDAPPPNGWLFEGDYSNTYKSTDNLKPEEAWNIDLKTDDGKPATGKFMIYETNGAFPNGQCTNDTSSSDFTTTYRLKSTTDACQPFWRREF